ncbi:MAG TPA: aldose 1-epimerase family protein [Actinobacteria bacterium]|nr:aldose 1-epimerase family protein [Actinomycetota bacterium]
MQIFGKETNRKEICEKTGDISQLSEVKYYEYIDGVSRGVRGIDIRNPEGVNLTILPDRGMDISSFSYKGIPFNWKSAVRETSSVYYESRGAEWLRTFYGGFLTTCGLTTTGPANTDNGEELGLHGRISNISAEKVIVDGEWKDDTYIVKARGKIREAKVFGDKLQLERKIYTWINKPKLVIEDTVENIGHAKSPLMILYHINIGYPVLDADSEVIEDKASIIPNDDTAKKEIGIFNKFSNPIKGFVERCYFHDIQADGEGYSNIALINSRFRGGQGIGLWIRFNKDNLPYLTQWKQMGMGEYVCGLEPCNNMGQGRKIEREKGRLRFIEPQEKIDYRLEFNILESNEAILDFRKKFSK